MCWLFFMKGLIFFQIEVLWYQTKKAQGYGSKALCKSGLKRIQFVVFLFFSFYSSNAFLNFFFLNICIDLLLLDITFFDFDFFRFGSEIRLEDKDLRSFARSGFRMVRHLHCLRLLNSTTNCWLLGSKLCSSHKDHWIWRMWLFPTWRMLDLTNGSS